MMSKSTILATLLAAATALMAGAVGHAQVEPSATGGATAKFDYDLSYSQTSEFYAAYTQALQRGIASGEVEYANGRARTPFSMTYSGGYIADLGGSTSSGTGTYQHLLISQGFATRRGGMSLGEELGFYPQSPTTGFSGIPGIGTYPGQPGPPGEPVISLTARSLSNYLTADFYQAVSPSTTIRIDGSFVSQRYPNGGGLDINQVSARPQASWRLNALNNASLQYSFSRFNYLGSPFTMETQSLQPGLYRVWNRRFKTSFAIGPEWLSSNNSKVSPQTVGLSANAEVTYSNRSTSATLTYYRAVTAGAGLGTQVGIRTNTVDAGVSRTFGRDLTIGGTGSYRDSQALVQSGLTSGAYGGVNATKRFGQNFTASLNYTVIHQTSSQSLQASALKGLAQVIGFSIAFHPRENHIIRK